MERYRNRVCSINRNHAETAEELDKRWREYVKSEWARFPVPRSKEEEEITFHIYHHIKIFRIVTLLSMALEAYYNLYAFEECFSYLSLYSSLPHSSL